MFAIFSVPDGTAIGIMHFGLLVNVRLDFLPFVHLLLLCTLCGKELSC